jgi:hypothetical protein
MNEPDRETIGSGSRAIDTQLATYRTGLDGIGQPTRSPERDYPTRDRRMDI